MTDGLWDILCHCCGKKRDLKYKRASFTSNLFPHLLLQSCIDDYVVTVTTYYSTLRPSSEEWGGPVQKSGAAQFRRVGLPSSEEWGCPVQKIGAAQFRIVGRPSSEEWGSPAQKSGAAQFRRVGRPSSEEWGDPVQKSGAAQFRRVG